MRRLILILLLSLLPLQASWAAVCAYCPGQCILEAGDERAVAPSLTDPAALLDLDTDTDCGCCQLGGVGIAGNINAGSTPPPQNGTIERHSTPLFNSIRPDRPERPKWQRAV